MLRNGTSRTPSPEGSRRCTEIFGSGSPRQPSSLRRLRPRRLLHRLALLHTEQASYFVTELKTGKFQPEPDGKLNFYCALVDDTLRRSHYNETTGMRICGTKSSAASGTVSAASRRQRPSRPRPSTKLPVAEQQALHEEGHLVAALERAKPDLEVDESAE